MSSAKEWTDPNWVVSADPDRLKADFAGWSSTVQKLVSIMHTNDIWALFNHPPATTYISEHGHVCLIGDAAHASTPHKGSGAGLVIEDAYILGNLLAEALATSAEKAGAASQAIAAAFRTFDATRRARTQRLVEDSRGTGEMYQLESEECGEDKDKLRELLLRRMDWVWDHDPTEELEATLVKLRSSLVGHES